MKVTVIVHNIDRASQFEDLINHHQGKVDYSFILIKEKSGYFTHYLKANHIPYVEITYLSKRDLLQTFLKVIRALKKFSPEAIHAHLVIAGLIGLSAALVCGIKKRIYTRHHSDYHHAYYPHGVKYDKLINYFATKVIAISPIVKDILINMEAVPKEKITLIPHGFHLQRFSTRNELTIERLREKYDLHNKGPIIGVVSRYTEWKGIQYIIPAFKKLLDHYPDAVLMLANAKGIYESEIKKILASIPPHNYIEIQFEPENISLFQLMDVFIHVPVNITYEAFGQVYVEGLASGVPSVFTFSGIAKEFIQDEINALIVPYCNTEAIYEAVMRILTDDLLKENLIKNGKSSVAPFDFSIFADKIFQLYEE